MSENCRRLGWVQRPWNSLDVSLSSIVQTGVLAWTAPGYGRQPISYDHRPSESRQLPIDRLPSLEATRKLPAASATR